MIDFKEPEVLFHTAALGHTGAFRTELDYWDTDGGLGHGICIHMSSLTGPKTYFKVSVHNS